MSLTEEQLAAVYMVTTSHPKVCCLTGAPGVGKTHTISELIRQLRHSSTSFVLCAPSGKAAQRMEEATGQPAQTIHRLLRLRPGSYDDPEPVTSSVVIVDEASMIGSELMACLLRACFGSMGLARTVLLVGDADQLPPVSPGAPFHDLLGSGVCPVVRLTKIQRQAESSLIVRAAHSIKAGRVPEWGPGFEFLECAEAERVPVAVWGVLNDLSVGPGDSQVLVPQNPRVCGAQAINAFVEEQRAWDTEWDNDLVRGVFREGTKVINTKNDYKREVFNGEIGYVVEATAGEEGSPGDDYLRVEIAGKVHDYRGGAIKNLKPAWALTVHRSQGSEWSAVVVVVHPSHSYMLTRSLLYVAVTRARERVVVVGTEVAVARAVKRVGDTRRRTWLRGRFERDRARREAVGVGA